MIKQKLKIVSWNINGFRAAIKKGFYDKIKDINPDIFCLQEIKAEDTIMQELYQKYLKENNFKKEKDQENHLFEANLEKNTQKIYLQNWSSCTLKKGYSGVLIGVLQNSKTVQNLSFEKTGQEEIDNEGRILIAKFEIKNSKNLKIALINGYYPQGGRGQYRIDYKLQFYSKIYEISEQLQKDGYKIILTGDFNTTVIDIDLARAKENKQTTGCLPEERLALSWLLNLSPELFQEYQDRGFFVENFQASPDLYQKLKKTRENKSLNLIDGFRYFYPEQKDKYTYWDQITRARDRNVGWRIDMFLIDPDLKEYLKDCQILDHIMGSDHCPICLDLQF
jgi:exodeoxyribonuclease-3